MQELSFPLFTLNVSFLEVKLWQMTQHKATITGSHKYNLCADRYSLSESQRETEEVLINLERKLTNPT